jgi:hypothetical protein
MFTVRIKLRGTYEYDVFKRIQSFNIKTDKAILTAGLEEGSYPLILLIKIKTDHTSTEVIFLMYS